METSAKQEHTLQNPLSQLVSKDWSQQGAPNVLPSSPATFLQSSHLPPALSLALGPQPKTVATPELIGLLQQWQQKRDAAASQVNCSRMGQCAASTPTVQCSHLLRQMFLEMLFHCMKGSCCQTGKAYMGSGEHQEEM